MAALTLSSAPQVRGVELGWGAMVDARGQDTLPFVRCRTYCVFGLSDSFSDLETTLNWRALLAERALSLLRQGMMLFTLFCVLLPRGLFCWALVPCCEGSAHTSVAPTHSLRVRGASVFMRRKGDSGERACERRLLEVDDSHELLDTLPLISSKVIEWFELLGLVQGDFTIGQPLREATGGADAVRAADVALGHGANFEVYRNWLISQGFDPDEDMK